MKISELNFEEHPVVSNGKRAVVDFANGYSASIVIGCLFYSRPECPYEIAVKVGDEIVYDTPITSDVRGYLTEDEANEILKEISELPERKGE